MEAEDIINLDSSSEEEKPRLENQENKNPEELDGIREEGEIGPGDDSHVEDMDLGDDIVVSKQSVVHASAEIAATGPTSLTVMKSSTDIILCDDQTPTRGVKRARGEYTENEPMVQVVFHSLTRESKRKLMESMQRWFKWHAEQPSMETKNEELESGEEIYYPALQVCSSTSKDSTLSFWIDNQARSDNMKDESSVPLYDREFALGSSSLDGSARFERSVKDDPRCFNCGSYGHSMKECPKPRDMAAVNSARRQHSAKKNLSNANHGQNRYYQTKPGKFDDLKPGVLGPETRECLGIREFDPPPWLHRMREIGYPPGYLEIVEDKNKPSGITIFTDEEEKDNNSDKKDDYEEGELPGRSELSSSEKVMTVKFPGINAPIPEKADPFLWSDNPPSASAPVYPPRYNPYDQYNGSSSQSPTLGRSLSDRGRIDGSLSHSPLSSYSYSHHYSFSSPDMPISYARGRERDRGRELQDDRDRERDRGRELQDHRRYHHHHHHRR
ncbi:Proline-rich spliceosome-associated (PSP) family protein / zinc knuckle (CCHC-type) family protein [Rhynchospora pubera]|uniref:Proline-rich spliceosome-associated (PSP) family protein / zinc knuckle (CCHC-type) family protein n=1 Tax=Rhynchospora pubera TaxID=906938 RepID=A0AAV8DV25_9POAL|nr:Proline-rich spliceosome-associated (PSP) family protein / zinc knuckle (CCHC-type) family protein [Rhynchospora pubera]KAJ4781672.1 Proline-rich spliceosome-associated (PSP) family protein / zinc knuckle (CCHC-type) family protein [Rhynchospora pubera]KAJ4808104.1 Proline-rich spliceosome-associated (PSP) family protein / zinc knuckle (CCHC-type) family protein [Rhynchospora pubera]